ncbi:MAG: hypothetical protein II874_07610 [Bacteroidales bacterium]|nr:hypothetical protein [Bacteroidales bacterium]
MRRCWNLLLPLTLLVACQQEEMAGPDDRQTGQPALSHGMIELGEKLEDPYTVENMREAVASLYPTRAGEIVISTTDLYVRFLPVSEADYASLVELGVRMTDHPMDYRIVREGDYYHDPELDDDAITWQYAVVPRDFKFPAGIRYELLDECYISENDPATRAESGLDWDAVEAEAYRLTGNEDLYPGTRAGEEPVFPAGRITVEDPEAFGGKPYGLAGVMVCCNSFVKFATGYTDRDGYYQLSKKFSSTPRYRLVFKNVAGFSIGMNLVLVPASVSTLGVGPAAGLDMHIDASSDGALFRRAAVNNAAYDYYARCEPSDLDLKAPPQDLRIWIFKNLDCSSAAMLHHGAFIEDNELVQKYLGGYASLLKRFLPDITIGAAAGDGSFIDIYSSVMHELAHASHYMQVGNAWWGKYITYILMSFVKEGREAYGSGTRADAGYCEVGEMWGYFMESVLFKDRYGGDLPTFGTSFWFYPQIFRYLYERGVTCSGIFRALKSTVSSRDDLQDALLNLYPERESMITQVFNRYSR